MDKSNTNSIVKIRGVLETDAVHLFPLINQSSVTDTIVWDGPNSLEDYTAGFRERERQHQMGEVHFFTILNPDNEPIGTITIRPENDFRGNIGLWIGNQFHGKGYGTEAIRLITDYGFYKLNLRKIEAAVFVGNLASRRIFEKNGYHLEGTIRSAIKKRGQFLDEWLLGIVNDKNGDKL